MLGVRRVIGAVGRALITAGILILLFVAYQLWGTGVLEARGQSELRDDFERELAKRPAATAPTSTTQPPASTTTTTTAPPPVPAGGEAVAIIRIPKIGVDKAVVEGTTVGDLRKGPGHYTGTPLPGQLGNAAIAGHRTTYGAPFGDLDQLARGDVISVQTLSGAFDYEVMQDGVFVVRPSQTEVLDPTPDTATLTLTSCNPKYSARERLIVKAQLAPGEPPPQPPPADVRLPENLDAGLSGTRGSRAPVVVWGAVVALVGGLWFLAFHRYHRWTTWFAGAIPFAVVLAVLYFFLERVLPSNY
jgi:sortase A